MSFLIIKNKGLEASKDILDFAAVPANYLLEKMEYQNIRMVVLQINRILCFYDWDEPR